MKYEKYYWLNNDSRLFLSRGYLRENETAEDRIRAIGVKAEIYLLRMSNNNPRFTGFADKFVDYMSRGWFSLASPVFSNFGRDGLPISCNGVYIADDMGSILTKVAEVGMQTKHGAGTSAYLGALRERGAKISTGGTADGPTHFAALLETTTDVISQGSVRRGSCAVYLDVERPDILEFLRIRSDGHAIQNLSLGVCITDDWMKAMIEGDKEKRKIWAAIIRKRYESGYPYVFFTDTVNRGRPQIYKDLELLIYASNLCAEIALHSSEDESFVCDLSSMNLLHYDEWKETDAVWVLHCLLDAVMQEYIEKTLNIPFMKASNNFAQRQRAIGIGVLGWHSYLQANNIAFESDEASALNIEIFELIERKSKETSRELAVLLGEPELLKGYGERNVTTMAVAPTTSSSFILGAVSPSIEPLASNYFTKDLAKGKFTYKNPYLKAVLQKYDQDTITVWDSILSNFGSVQHLDFLTQHERDVFKTFSEISQLKIVSQAAERQEFIDQSQSLNIMVHPDTPPKETSDLMITGWMMGVKTFYYQRSYSKTRILNQSLTDCVACSA